MKIGVRLVRIPAGGLPLAGTNLVLLAANPRRTSLRIKHQGADESRIMFQTDDAVSPKYYPLEGAAGASVLFFDGKESCPKGTVYVAAAGATASVSAIETFDEEGLRS